jgi:hypothetical protein
MPTNSIAGVLGVPASRPDADATARTASATIASDHSTQKPRAFGLEIRFVPELYRTPPKGGALGRRDLRAA